MFIHVGKVSFQDNESRTLKGLLDDYNHLLSNHNFPKCERTSKLKSILEKEFGDAISFHNRFQKNQSCVVYNFSEGGSYIEAEINAWRISEDDLLCNIASRLRNKTTKFTNIAWPPHPKHLDNPPNMPEELLKFLVWLKYPTYKSEEYTMNNRQIVALRDLLLAYVVNKRTKFQVNVAYFFYNVKYARIWDFSKWYIPVYLRFCAYTEMLGSEKTRILTYFA